MDNNIKQECLPIIRKIKKLNLDKNKEYVVYPFGKMGKRVRAVLDYLGFRVPFVIDNNLYDENLRIKKCSNLKDIDVSKYVFLFCCVRLVSRSELLSEIKKYVPNEIIVDLFPVGERKLGETLKFWRHKSHFLWSIKNEEGVRVLDVGCGNKSAANVKAIADKCFYTGIDVGDYNQTQSSINLIDDYHVVPSEKFASEIEKFLGTEDYVISSHNLEHCNEPKRVVYAMCNALKHGGRLYMAFPSRESVFFPSRQGTLNFYDDCTHIYLPDFDKVLAILKECGMEIIFKTKAMKGWYLKHLGKKNEALSIAQNTVLGGTWDYWGFESIIWAKKK